MTTTATRPGVTLLKALVRERRLTVKETLVLLQRRAEQMGRSQLAGVLEAYYGDPAGLYSARVGRSTVALSILTDPTWVGLSVPLGGGAERCRRGARVDGLRVRLSRG